MKKKNSLSSRTRYRSRSKRDRSRSRSPFTMKDYRSGDGMITRIWGPTMWHFLHTMSFNYPVHPSCEDKKNYRDFILNLQNTLPCKYCRQNLTKNLSEMPLRLGVEMESRDSFSRYIYRLHERVNKMLGKESGLSFSDVRDRYEHFRSHCTQGTDGSLKTSLASRDEHSQGTDGSSVVRGSKKTAKKSIMGGDDSKSKSDSKKYTLKRSSLVGASLAHGIPAGASTTSKKHTGCTVPLHGKKAKAIIEIVPLPRESSSSSSSSSIIIDKKCLLKAA